MRSKGGAGRMLTGRSLLVTLVALQAPLVSARTTAGGEREPIPAEHPPGSWLVDRVAIRFWAPETGGRNAPQFVFERELVLEAWLEAGADPRFDVSVQRFAEQHVRAALERHVAEQLLASLVIDPEPTAAEKQAREGAVLLGLAQGLGGSEALRQVVASLEMGQADLGRLLSRRARASLYLDRMVAPLLAANEPELRAIHAAGQSPYSDRPFAEIVSALERWYLTQRLTTALRAFYEGARTRLQLHWVGDLSPEALSSRWSPVPGPREP